ncbi:MAG: hypothetical protein ACYCPS_00945 [Candidatus Saccharimonadales bacterium]
MGVEVNAARQFQDIVDGVIELYPGEVSVDLANNNVVGLQIVHNGLVMATGHIAGYRSYRGPFRRDEMVWCVSAEEGIYGPDARDMLFAVGEQRYRDKIVRIIDHTIGHDQDQALVSTYRSLTQPEGSVLVRWLECEYEQRDGSIFRLMRVLDMSEAARLGRYAASQAVGRSYFPRKRFHGPFGALRRACQSDNSSPSGIIDSYAQANKYCQRKT